MGDDYLAAATDSRTTLSGVAFEAFDAGADVQHAPRSCHERLCGRDSKRPLARGRRQQPALYEPPAARRGPGSRSPRPMSANLFPTLHDGLLSWGTALSSATQCHVSPPLAGSLDGFSPFATWVAVPFVALFCTWGEARGIIWAFGVKSILLESWDDWLLWAVLSASILIALQPGPWLRSKSKRVLDSDSRSNHAVRGLHGMADGLKSPKAGHNFQMAHESLLQAAAIEVSMALGLDGEGFRDKSVKLAGPNKTVIVTREVPDRGALSRFLILMRRNLQQHRQCTPTRP